MSKSVANITPEDSPRQALWCQALAWSISFSVCLVATVAWGQSYGWQLLPINNYLIFPLLGLLAFSLMWSHYMAATIRQLLHLDQKVLSTYFKSTSWVVFVLLCLHPGLLIWQRYRDGYGLPPQSYESYVAPGLGWVTLLGTASWLAFMAFEFRRKFGKRSWWHYVETAGDVAMLAVLYHGLRLGGQLQQGWFRYVWAFYALALVMVLIRKYYLKYSRVEAASKEKPGHDSGLL